MEQVTTAANSLSLFQEAAKFMNEGGIFSWSILFLWIAALAVAVERTFKLKSFSIDAPSFMNEIKKFILAGDVISAIDFSSKSKAFVPKVVRAGLKRVNQPRQQIQDMVEATLIECRAELDRGIPLVGLIANVSTLVGLLGTIHGLIMTFSNLAVQDPAEKAKQLSLGISIAMNTTALGLVCSITLLFVHLYLAGRAQKLLFEMDENSMRLVDLLSTRKAVLNDKNEEQVA
jgi:biopolymer transport protein ExbB/TolQ